MNRKHKYLADDKRIFSPHPEKTFHGNALVGTDAIAGIVAMIVIIAVSQTASRYARKIAKVPIIFKKAGTMLFQTRKSRFAAFFNKAGFSLIETISMSTASGV